MPRQLSDGYCTGQDGDLDAFAGRSVAVIGYGHLGRSVALNLRDSGLAVTVGSREDASAETARADGFAVEPIAAALAENRLSWVLLPDEVIPTVLGPETVASLPAGSLLCLSSGYVLAYGLVDLSDAPVDVVMLAPRMVGTEVRRCYLDGKPFFGYMSVEQDRSGKAEALLLGLGRAVGTTRFRGVALTARQEATVDLFVEQTVGPVLGNAVMCAFNVGVEAGIPPEALVLELYQSGEMSRTWQAFADEGFYRAVRLHGRAAAFGGFVHIGDVDSAAMTATFEATLEQITDGSFSRRFEEEREAGYPNFDVIDAMTAGDDAMSRAETRVRSWFEPAGSVAVGDGRVGAPADGGVTGLAEGAGTGAAP